MRIKLLVVVTDLLGLSGLRILHALANGETDAKNLALLGDHRLKCSEEQLIEALTGSSHPMRRQMLALQLERLRLIDEQIAKLNSLIAQAMNPHQDTVIRLAEVPGLGIDSAQQIIAEVGVTASTFPSAAECTSWVGTCPGKQESAEENFSSRSAKGNKYMRRVLNQAANATWEIPRLCRGGSQSLTVPGLCFQPASQRNLREARSPGFCFCSCFCFHRLRSGPFEGPATVKPPALPVDTYCCRPEQRHTLSGSVPTSAAAPELSVCRLGYRTSSMPPGLEDSS